MKTANKHRYFCKELERTLVASRRTAGDLAAALHYKNHRMVTMWTDGRTVPDIHTVVKIAHELATPAEDLILPLLADLAPDHLADFWIIADGLLGEDRADELFADKEDASERAFSTTRRAGATTKHAYLSSVLRRICAAHGLNANAVAGRLGLPPARLLTWQEGLTLPTLDVLPQLAFAVDLPHEDLLLCWLADTCPEQAFRYWLMACQVMGEAAADDLFSGASENSASPWWANDRKPVSAAEIMSREDEPRWPRLPPG